MPSWTTGGTDVICEKETDKRGEIERNGVKGVEGWGWGGLRETERDREGGREREMRQGYRDERKESLPPFFQYPLLMKFHLDCKCSVIYHHKRVMGP